MKGISGLAAIIALAGIVAAGIGWRKVAALNQVVAALQAENSAMKEQLTAQTPPANEQAPASDEKAELLKLRSEVNQLRIASKEVESLRGQNQQLRAQNQQLQTRNATAAAGQTPPPTQPAPAQAGSHFPREAWTFAGYATPESALVSAVWAMKEGNPQTYLASLSPEEQARMAQAWEGKQETEIAAKHQTDVSRITGVRIVDKQSVSPTEIMMNVYVEGANQSRKVNMKNVNGEWKFGGFVADPPAPGQ